MLSIKGHEKMHLVWSKLTVMRLGPEKWGCNRCVFGLEDGGEMFVVFLVAESLKGVVHPKGKWVSSALFIHLDCYAFSGLFQL